MDLLARMPFRPIVFRTLAEQLENHLYLATDVIHQLIDYAIHHRAGVAENLHPTQHYQNEITDWHILCERIEEINIPTFTQMYLPTDEPARTLRINLLHKIGSTLYYAYRQIAIMYNVYRSHLIATNQRETLWNHYRTRSILKLLNECHKHILHQAYNDETFESDTDSDSTPPTGPPPSDEDDENNTIGIAIGRAFNRARAQQPANSNI